MSANSDSEVEVQPKAKKRKFCGNICEYEINYPVMRKSNVSNNHAYCSLCRADFSIGHGGIGDVTKHVKTSKHAAKAVKSGQSTRKIQQFFVDSSGKDLNVIQVEHCSLSSLLKTIYHWQKSDMH